jgi:hypothetical protein
MQTSGSVSIYTPSLRLAPSKQTPHHDPLCAPHALQPAPFLAAPPLITHNNAPPSTPEVRLTASITAQARSGCYAAATLGWQACARHSHAHRLPHSTQQRPTRPHPRHGWHIPRAREGRRRWGSASKGARTSAASWLAPPCAAWKACPCRLRPLPCACRCPPLERASDRLPPHARHAALCLPPCTRYVGPRLPLTSLCLRALRRC